MLKQNHSFVYYFAWLVIGLLFGLSILLFRGDISIDIHQHSNPADKATHSPGISVNFTQNKNSGVVSQGRAVMSMDGRYFAKSQEGGAIYEPKDGFADAVMKAAPAVVSIQTITWSETSTEETTDEKLLQQFLGRSSPHGPRRKAERSEERRVGKEC